MTPRSRRTIVAIRRERKALAVKAGPKAVAYDRAKDIHFVDEYDFGMGWNLRDRADHRKAAYTPTPEPTYGVPTQTTPMQGTLTQDIES